LVDVINFCHPGALFPRKNTGGMEGNAFRRTGNFFRHFKGKQNIRLPAGDIVEFAGKGYLIFPLQVEYTQRPIGMGVVFSLTE